MRAKGVAAGEIFDRSDDDEVVSLVLPLWLYLTNETEPRSSFLSVAAIRNLLLASSHHHHAVIQFLLPSFSLNEGQNWELAGEPSRRLRDSNYSASSPAPFLQDTCRPQAFQPVRGRAHRRSVTTSVEISHSPSSSRLVHLTRCVFAVLLLPFTDDRFSTPKGSD